MTNEPELTVELTASYETPEDGHWAETRVFTEKQMAAFWTFWDQGEEVDIVGQ